MPNPLPRLILFPGLGVDSGLFLPQMAVPARVEVPPWVDPIDGEDLPEYARRMAATVDPDPALGPLWLGGLSFGACVALEAASVLRPRGVFFMSAGLSGRTITPWMRLFLQSAANLSPAGLRRMLRLTPLFVRIVGRARREHVRFIKSLVPRVNARLCLWGGPAIVRWTYSGGVACPIHHIHGEIDRIVPLENVRPTVIIRGAGHALNVTHAEEVNAYIERVMGK